MKQTAVEWLLNKFQEIHKDYGGLDLQWLERFQQAKEMEKQQIIDAFNLGQQEEAKQPFWTKGNEYYEKNF